MMTMTQSKNFFSFSFLTHDALFPIFISSSYRLLSLMVHHLRIAEKKEWQLESSQNRAHFLFMVSTPGAREMLNQCLRIDGASIDRNQPILLSLWME